MNLTRVLANAIAVDSSGAAYVTGGASAGLPVTPGVFGPSGAAPGNALSAFVTKLHPAGCAFAYSTYINGGTFAGTAGNGIAVDTSGNAYVAGIVDGNAASVIPFPEVNSLQPPLFPGIGSAFVSELSPAGSSLLFSTVLGGSGGAGLDYADTANAIAVNATGNIYVAGQTLASDFPELNAFEPNCTTCSTSQNSGGFVTKLAPGNAMGILLTRPQLTFAPVPLHNDYNPQAEAIGLQNSPSSPLNIQSVAVVGPGFSLQSGAPTTA